MAKNYTQQDIQQNEIIFLNEVFIDVLEHSNISSIENLTRLKTNSCSDITYWNVLLIDDLQELIRNPKHEFGDILQEIFLKNYASLIPLEKILTFEFFDNIKSYIQSDTEIRSFIKERIETLGVILNSKLYKEFNKEFKKTKTELSELTSYQLYLESKLKEINTLMQSEMDDYIRLSSSRADESFSPGQKRVINSLKQTTEEKISHLYQISQPLENDKYETTKILETKKQKLAELFKKLKTEYKEYFSPLKIYASSEDLKSESEDDSASWVVFNENESEESDYDDSDYTTDDDSESDTTNYQGKDSSYQADFVSAFKKAELDLKELQKKLEQISRGDVMTETTSEQHLMAEHLGHSSE